MRQIRLSNKKLRGRRRRLRSLEKWAVSFEGAFPAYVFQSQTHFYFKIPVHIGLVEGRDATLSSKRACAQQLINACSHLIANKPEDVFCRIVARICLPDMFSSEICVYTDEEYFLAQTRPTGSGSEKAEIIRDRRLSHDWNLKIPQGLGEYGLSLAISDPDDWFADYDGEHWLFGDIAD